MIANVTLDCGQQAYTNLLRPSAQTAFATRVKIDPQATEIPISNSQFTFKLN